MARFCTGFMQQESPFESRLYFWCIILTDRVETASAGGDNSPKLLSAMFEHFWRRMPAVMTRSSSTWVGPANIAPPVTPDGRHHGIDAEDVDGPPQIVDECREASRETRRRSVVHRDWRRQTGHAAGWHCHVWTAPADQGLFCGGAFDRGCGHVFGLLICGS
jgi:hypothetical protein